MLLLTNRVTEINKGFFMEYQFRHDPVSGLASARFSVDHEVFGPWLETELGKDSEKMKQLLTAINDIAHAKTQQITIVGHEYSVTVETDDVTIQNNILMNGALDALPEQLAEDCHDFEQINFSQCGLEDFRQLLLSWSKFIQ
jgi:uncharacterized protein